MKKFMKRIAWILISVMILCSFSGCDILDGDDMEYDSGNNGGSNGDSGNVGEKDFLDDLLDSLIEDDGSDDSDSYVDEDDDDDFFQGSTSTDDGDDLLDTLFDAFFGGSSSDYGWDDSSYSDGGHVDSNFEYADVDSIPSGNGKATIMVYIIGSNLESDSGCATMDIQEMFKANVGDNVNVIIEAGGAKKWQNKVVANGKVGRFKVEGNSLKVLQERGKTSMVEPDEVKDFIKWTAKNYPADRYGFIFWNHGGGTMAGFGMDDLFEGELSLDEFSDIFKSSGINFDFVGFDACLMGTVETAYSLIGSADYLIAAEEEEPGYGWSYTGWLKALTKNPSLDMETLGSIIIDDFVASNGSDDVTLSLIDLSKIKNVYSKICDLCAEGNKELYAGNYKSLAKVRKNTKNFGEGGFEQIDIIDFCNNCGLDGADEVIKAVNEAVVYHKTNIGRTNGLAMYFPYDMPSYYKEIKGMLKSFGMNNDKANAFFSNFLSAKSGGSVSKAMTPMSVKTGYEDDTTDEDLTTEEWYNEEIASETDIVEFPLDDEGLLTLTEAGDGYVLELTDEQWDAVAMADIGVYLDDGEGYYDIGWDNAYGLDDDGNIIVDFDYTWVALDGNLCAFYAIEEGETADGSVYTYGYTEAEFTSARTGETKDIEILIYWDEKHPEGYVRGYRNATDDGLALAERNVVSFIKGDKLQFVCDYYTYDGEFESSYYISDVITVNGPLKVSYEEIDDFDAEVYGHILDVYGNDYYTETVSLTLG